VFKNLEFERKFDNFTRATFISYIDLVEYLVGKVYIKTYKNCCNMFWS